MMGWKPLECKDQWQEHTWQQGRIEASRKKRDTLVRAGRRVYTFSMTLEYCCGNTLLGEDLLDTPLIRTLRMDALGEDPRSSRSGAPRNGMYRAPSLSTLSRPADSGYKIKIPAISKISNICVHTGDSGILSRL